jgi:hypothetical protein
MRRYFLIFGSAPVVTALLFACEDDTSPRAGAFGFDASVPGFSDAAPFTEASVPPAAPKVTVTVVGASGPKANVRIVFHDGAGAVLETKVTGADGKASSTGALPVMASALLGTGSERHIVTWTAIENGDDLVIRDPASSRSVGSFDVTLPTLPLGSVGVDLFAGECFAFTDTTSASVTLSEACAAPLVSVLASSRDEGSQVAAYSFRKGNAISPDAGAVSVSTSAWSTPVGVTLSATNVPESASASASLLQIADGHGYPAGNEQSLANGPASFPTASGFADALQGSINLFTGAGSRQVIAKRVALGDAIAFDASQVLPAITGATVTGDNARRPVFTWTSSSTASADGGLVRARFFGSEDASYAWTIIVPPGATSVTAPAMPADADSFLPTLTDAGAATVFLDPEVAFVEAESLPSYAAFRRVQGSLLGVQTSLGAITLPAMPTNGTYRATAYMQQPL